MHLILEQKLHGQPGRVDTNQVAAEKQMPGLPGAEVEANVEHVNSLVPVTFRLLTMVLTAECWLVQGNGYEQCVRCVQRQRQKSAGVC